MEREPASDFASLLRLARQGDRTAAARVWERVYGELRRIAHARVARVSPATRLGTTALVHEAYIRLAGAHALACADAQAFYSAAARAMRNILVDEARSRACWRRGGAHRHVPLSDAIDPMRDVQPDVEALDHALSELEELDPELVELIQLRYFAGLSVERTIELLGMSAATYYRRWSYARAWLLRELERARELARK